MYQFIILSLAATVSANVYVSSPCPAVQTAENFEYKSFGHGRWYELARYDNNGEHDGKCSYEEYTPSGDGFKIKNYDYLNGKLRSIEGYAKLAPNAHGQLIYSYPYGPNKSITENIFNILLTDNDNFVLGYHCEYNQSKGIRQDFAWIISRSKTLSDASKAAIDDYLHGSKILQKSNFIFVDFSDPVCSSL